MRWFTHFTGASLLVACLVVSCLGNGFIEREHENKYGHYMDASDCKLTLADSLKRVNSNMNMKVSSTSIGLTSFVSKLKLMKSLR